MFLFRWLPGKLHLQVQALDADPEAGVVYSWFIVRDRGGESFCPHLHVPPSGWILRRLLMGNFCGNSLGILIGRRALLEVGNFDESLSGASMIQIVPGAVALVSTTAF